METTGKTYLALQASLGLTIGISAAPAFAQEEKQITSDPVEIISISRKRPESIQEVPIAVTALSARELEAAGVERPSDFISLIPNVSIVDSANVGDTQVNIRGITSTRDAESTFAYVVDGVLQTNPNSFNGDLTDIAQIEVLKGPQGALYGRNAVAGAILITTEKPSDVVEARIEGGFGNNNSQKYSGMLTGPLADNVFGRIVVAHSTTDGFYENVYLGRDDAVDYLEDTSVRGRLIWEASDALTYDLRGSYSEAKGGAINFNAVFGLPSFVEGFGQDAFFEDVNDHEFIFAFNVPGENEQKTTELSLKADWRGEGFDVSTVIAYNNLEEYLLSDGTSASFYGYELTEQCQTDRATLNNLPTDLGGAGRSDLFGDFLSPFVVLPPGQDFQGVYGPYTPTSCDGYQYQERNQQDYSGEIRFTSNDTDSPLQWIAGVYFANIDRDVVVAYGADLGQGFLRQAYVPADGPNPTDLLFDDTFSTTVLSTFGQLEYDVNDKWEVSFALRYDNESREVSNNVPNVSASGFNVNTIVDGVVGPINPAFTDNPDGIPDRDQSYSQWQPKLTVSYEASDAINLYASYGVGFRSGGFNSIGTEATLDFWFNASGNGTPGDAVDAQLIVPDNYDKEITTSIEFGGKGTFLDNRLKVNSAVFHTKVEDNQFFEFFAGPFGLLRAVTTIDELEIQGFEMDVNYRVNDNLTVFGGMGLIDSEIIENKNRPLSEGNEAPQTPKSSYTLGISYEHEITGDLLLATRVDYQYVGETNFHTLQGEETPTIWDYFGTLGGGVPPGPHSQNFTNAERDAYNTINARISIEGEMWTVALWGKNLTNEAYLQEVIPAPEFGGSFVHPSALRSYGLELSMNF
ncbi:TonB-dependent receptor [Alteromonas sp. 14N.309.X.WAT.G.H12]|uniref:TonB-dependent receptor n=1 Tax=Alteromonas sp. 14N.309.X.WAT.G.H12 TaxID=3120824 RepID=UPI002FD5C30F